MEKKERNRKEKEEEIQYHFRSIMTHIDSTLPSHDTIHFFHYTNTITTTSHFIFPFFLPFFPPSPFFLLVTSCVQTFLVVLPSQHSVFRSIHSSFLQALLGGGLENCNLLDLQLCQKEEKGKRWKEVRNSFLC